MTISSTPLTKRDKHSKKVHLSYGLTFWHQAQVIQFFSDHSLIIYYFLAIKSKLLRYITSLKRIKGSIFFTIHSTSLKLDIHMCLSTLYYHTLFHRIIPKRLCFIEVRSHGYITWLFQAPPSQKGTSTQKKVHLSYGLIFWHQRQVIQFFSDHSLIIYYFLAIKSKLLLYNVTKKDKRVHLF